MRILSIAIVILSVICAVLLLLIPAQNITPQLIKDSLVFMFFAIAGIITKINAINDKIKNK